MSSIDPKEMNEVQIWPWIKAYCAKCSKTYWFQKAIPLDIALYRIDCDCGAKSHPSAVFAYPQKQDH